nr:hypothetical protein [Tanacetum cinerariifolium]
MRTRSTSYPFNSNATIPKRSNRRRVLNIVEPEIRTIKEVVPMADHTMEELLQAPTEGYGEAIVILEILVENFEIKTNLLQDVLNDVIKLMLFPYSLKNAARIWTEKEPPNSILTWDDLVNKFVNQFFPASKTTHLKNEISRFTQRFEETFREAWDRFKEMLRAYPHHGFSEVTQIDTFYNGLNEQNQDSLNVATGGNLLNKTTREALKIIENKSKGEMKAVTTRCGLAYEGPSIPTDSPLEKSLLTNKDKLFELAKVLFNENCSAMLLKKLPEKLEDPELTPTRMTLELADRSITHPKGVVKDVFVKVGKFHFPTDFVVIDFKADPRVPQILRRSFLRTGRALIDVYGEEITLRYNPMNSNPTLVFDPLISDSGSCKEPIVKSSSPTLTPFRESDFFLKEIEDFLNDDLIPMGIDNSFYDLEGDILFLEKLLHEDPFQLPLMDLKLAEETKAKSSIKEPPKLELKELPSHLEYAFLEKSNKLSIIIAKDLKDVEKEALIKVLKSHKWAIAWKISDIKVKKEVIKLFDAGMIYPISDSSWVSPIHCVPKKGGMTVVANENNELIPTRLVTGWRMLERLVGNEFYCFLDGFSGYFQIPIDPQDQEKTTFTCPYGTFTYRRMPFGLCNAPPTFQREGIVLGHKILKSGIEVDRVKVDIIAKLPHTTTVKCVRSFLGHAGFYRRFIQDFSKIARPMTHLLEIETPFVFSKECVDAFDTLKKKLTKAPILVVPDWNLHFELMCDASDFAIGVVLGQRKMKHFQPIHYASKTMTEAQIHYTMTEKEMLAVVYAFEKFRPYLVLSKSIVYTNHLALKYLLNKQDAKSRLLRWVLLLQEFDITILDKKDLRIFRLTTYQG